MNKWGPLASRYENPHVQRKILSLDGGGIRGVLTLEILLELETQLKAVLSKGDDFRLSDYFDYIGGTSTGAIIAAGLAKGMSVQELLNFYQDKGEAMFDKSSIFKKLNYLYNDAPLLEELKNTFGEGDIDINEGDGRGGLKTLMLVVTMNRTTDSPWPISNNPFAKYNDTSRPDCNLRIPLYQLVRASTAAPVYFPSQKLVWDPNDPKKDFVFVDGGVTPYNNPAFLMYRMATQQAYNLNWETGEQKLMIVSVGTGSAPGPGEYDFLWNAAMKLPNNLMYTMQVDQDINCRTVGRCRFGAKIDRELSDMIPLDNTGRMLGLNSDASRHFSYVRYNADLSQEGLNKAGLADIKSDEVRQMDSIKYIPQLREVGKTIGSRQVNVKRHFRNFVPTQTILFSGHLIDAADRPEARFPASKEDAAKNAILKLLTDIKNTNCALVGVAGAACGGDILFLEACLNLDIPVEIYLALPVEEFKRRSVSYAGQTWDNRFDELIKKQPVHVLPAITEASDANVWERANERMLSDSLTQSGENLTMIALWDGKGGDGPGGTEHMVNTTKELGAEVKIIQIDKL